MRGCFLILTLPLFFASGCYRVAEVSPRQLARLDRHREGDAPVKVHTLDDEDVDIEGDFKEARVLIDDDAIVLRPPFRAFHRGQTLVVQQGGEPPIWIHDSRVERVEVVQRDGRRTEGVIVAVVLGVATGALIGTLLTKRDDQGDANCAGCGLAIGAVVGGGAMLALSVSTSQSY